MLLPKYPVTGNVRSLSLFILTCVLTVLFHAHAGAEEIVQEVLIQGNQRVHDSSIRFYISHSKGKPYSPRNARNDIKKLYTLGYFDDIRIELKQEPSGVTLTYFVKEKPFLSSIVITGADAVKKSDIEEKLGLKKGTHFKRSAVLQDVETIKKLYREKGYYLVGVKTSEKVQANNTIRLEFEIDEGKKIHVDSIYFYGNKNFSSKTLLSILETNTTGMFSWLTESGTYKKDVLKTDLLKLQNFYGNNGYIQFRIEDPRVEIDKESGEIHIGFYLHEGDQFKVGKLDVTGDEIYTEEKIRTALKIKPGDIFDRSLFGKDIFSITELYLVKGFAYADVLPKTKIDNEKKVVDIAISVNHGP
ncbi:MAG: POTRA domain-containing protein, partial [Nitrospinota bacterium]